MIKYILLAILVVLPAISFAQFGSVKGTVYEKDGAPAFAASIQLIPADPNGKSVGTSSDAIGYFGFSHIPAGSYTIKVRLTGFEEYSEVIEINEKDVPNIQVFLKEKAEELGPVTIVDNNLLKDNPVVSVVTWTPEDIKRVPVTMGDADLVNALLVTPGVISSGDQGGQLYIRGGPPIQNKVLMDGAVLYNPFHSIGLLSVFDTDLIRSADIYTGGFGAQYGGRISSVMDIQMRDGNMKRFAGKVGINPVSSKFIIEGPFKKLKESGGSSASFLLNARGSYLQYSSRAFYPYANVTPNNSVTQGLPYNFWDIYGKISVNAGDQGSRINMFGFSHNDYVNFSDITTLHWNAAGGGLNFVVVPGAANVRIDGVFSYSRYAIEMQENNDLKLVRESTVDGFNFGLNFHQFYGVNRITYGLEATGSFTHLLYDTPYSTRISNDNNTTEIAAFARAKVNKWGFVFEPSFRLHYYASIGEVSPEPRLSLKYNITEWWRIKAAGGMYSQNLVAANSDRDVVNLFYGFLSGVENVPNTYRGEKVTSRLSRAQHGILGMEFDLGKYIDLNIEGYFMNFSQLLNVNRNKQYDDVNNGQPDYLKKDVIVEYGYATGLDATVKFEYKNFYVWLVYSFMKTERTDEVTTYTPHFARQHNINVVANYEWSTTKDKKKKDWSASVRWNLGSGFPFTQTQGFYEFLNFQNGINTDYTTANGTVGIQYAAPNTGNLPWYHRLDINIRKAFYLSQKNKNLKLEVNAGASNVYNRNNIFYIDRVTFQKIYQLPIIYNLGVTFEW